jgi:hypothetical protein
MKRAEYYNYIEERLVTLAHRITIRGGLNLLDYHIYSEEFFRDLLNLLFEFNLINVNKITHNATAIDLIDSDKKIIIQVSSTSTKTKIENSLNNDFSKYDGYTFQFLSIAKSGKYLRTISYTTPKKLIFNPKKDIYDVKSILSIIKDFRIEKQKIVYDFIKKELGGEVDSVKTESNLTSIINLLSDEKLVENSDKVTPIAFDIEKKIEFNGLVRAKYTIDDYAVYTHHLDRIYNEFDSQGKNKSMSVLASIRKMYTTNPDHFSGDELFLHIIESIIERVRVSGNFENTPFEELELCASILSTDTFIRYKIFENPEGYNYATA